MRRDARVETRTRVRASVGRPTGPVTARVSETGCTATAANGWSVIEGVVRARGRRAAAVRPAAAPPKQEPCHTIESVLDELEDRTRNTIRVNRTEATFPQLSTPTELQARALALINERVPPIT